jgi:RHS repeat-associated protein
MRDGKGHTYTFGAARSSSTDGPQIWERNNGVHVGRGVTTWLLSQMQDIHGNYFRVSYDVADQNNSRVPLAIDYTLNDAAPPARHHRIVFVAEPRADSTPMPAHLDVRLHQIAVQAVDGNGNAVGNRDRTYTLSYETSVVSGRSRLISVAEQGTANGEVTVAPTRTFTYMNDPGGFNPMSEEQVYPYTSQLTLVNESPSNRVWTGFGDFNGDGYADMARLNYKNITPGDPLDGTQALQVALGSSAGLLPPQPALEIGPHQNYGWFLDGAVGDFNGDGYDDIILVGQGINNTIGRYVIRVAIFFGSPQGPLPAQFVTAWGGINRDQDASGNWRLTVRDVNGDGLADIVLLKIDPDGRPAGFVYALGGQTWPPTFVATGRGALPTLAQGTTFRGLVSGDFDGDGTDDLALLLSSYGTYSSTQPAQLIVGRAMGGPTGLGDPTWVERDLTARGAWLDHVLLAGDVNGDGRSDLVLNFTGLGGALVSGAPYGRDTRAQLGPMDGPMKDLLLVTPWTRTYDYPNQYVAPGVSGLNTITVPDGNPTHLNPYTHLLADMNGDGIDDHIQSYVGSLGRDISVILNDPVASYGFNLSNDPGLLIANSGASDSDASGPARFQDDTWKTRVGDLNGDGNADLVLSYYSKDGRRTQYLLGNSATGFARDASGNADLRTRLSCGNPDCYDSPRETFLADINGDGKQDIIYVPRGAGGAMSYLISVPLKPDLLRIVDNGIGGTTVVTYTPATRVPGAIQSSDPTCVSAVPGACGVPDHRARDLVTQLVRSNGRGQQRSFSYTYSNGRLAIGGVLQRTTLGFEVVTQTDMDTGISTSTTYRLDQPYQGLALNRTTFANTGSGTPPLMSRVSFDWTQVAAVGVNAAPRPDTGQAPTDQPVQLRLASQHKDVYEYTTGELAHTLSKSYGYDPFHNITSVIDCGDSPPPSTTQDCLTTRTIYANAEDIWMIGRPDQTWTTQSDAAGTGTLVLQMDWNVYGPSSIADPIERRFTLAEHDRLLFDDASAANCAGAMNGDGTACASEVQTGLARRVAVEQSYGYDVYGNPRSVTDNDGQITISAYDDAYHTYLAKTTNALTQTEWRIYDDFGSQTGAIDRSGQQSTIQYDGLGRRVAEWFPGFTPTGVTRAVPQRSYAYVSFGDPNVQYVSQIDRSSSTLEHEVRHLFDGTGTEYQTLDFSDINAEQPIATDRLEDFAPSVANPQAQRRIVALSEPHFRGDPTQWLQVEYDQADRPVSVRRMNNDRSADAPLILPGGFTLPPRPIVQLAYQGTSRLSSINSADGNGHSTLRRFDARGRLVSQVDAEGNVTSHGYDGLGRPTRVTPRGMDPITVSYDLWGRKRTVADPQTGMTRYTYFDFGPVATITNPVGDQINFTYDPLHRVMVEDDRSQAGTLSRFGYAYDAPTGNGIGRLTAVTECALNVACTVKNPSPDGAPPAGTSSFSFDSLGNVSEKSVTIAGLSGSYTRSYTYDWMSRVVQKSFPDDVATAQQNVYLNDGTPSEVRLIGGSHGSLGTRVTRFYNHNAHHQIGTKELWSGGTNAAILTNYQYNNFHWLATLVSTQASFPVGARLQSLTYVYDNVGNVTNTTDDVAVPSQSEEGTFTYDPLDRLKSATGSYGRVGYAYDPVGNFTQRGPLTYQYSACGDSNAYRCIDGVPSGPNAEPFHVVHDPAGRRVSQSATGDWTYQYDARGQLVSASLNNVAVATMAYNFVGQRVRKTFTPTSSRPTPPFLISVPLRPQTGWLPVAFALTTTTYYIDDDFEIRVSDSSQTPQEVVKHIQLPGIGKLATINTGSIPGQPTASDVADARSAVPLVGSTVSGTADGTWFYLANHIGTSSVVVDATAQQVNQLVYEPYGTLLRERSSGFDTVTHKFTGQEEDEESGLIYYGSRYYDPISARFITPDSIVPSGGLSPQALNRFAYVQNNPLRYIDRTGHLMEENPFEAYELWIRLAVELGLPYVISVATEGVVAVVIAALATAPAGAFDFYTPMEHWGTGIIPPADIDDRPISQLYDLGVLTQTDRYLPEEARILPELFIGHQEMRFNLGLPPLEAKNAGTVARFDLQGLTFWGRNGRADYVSLFVNPITEWHAEADAMNQPYQAGIRGGHGVLTVDRELCPACGKYGGVLGMANQLELESLTVLTPSGMQYYSRAPDNPLSPGQLQCTLCSSTPGDIIGTPGDNIPEQ